MKQVLAAAKMIDTHVGKTGMTPPFVLIIMLALAMLSVLFPSLFKRCEASFAGKRPGKVNGFRLILLIVFSFSIMLQCQAMAPAAAAGKAAPNPDPKRPLLIKHGWEFPSVTFVSENIRTMEKRPVDGVVISMDDDLSGKVMSTTPVSYEEFAENLRPLAGLNSPTLKHNFVIVFATPAGNIFDEGWDVVAQNFGNLAKAAKETGLEGIFFDIEEYFGDSLIYPANC